MHSSSGHTHPSGHSPKTLRSHIVTSTTVNTLADFAALTGDLEVTAVLIHVPLACRDEVEARLGRFTTTEELTESDLDTRLALMRSHREVNLNSEYFEEDIDDNDDDAKRVAFDRVNLGLFVEVALAHRDSEDESSDEDEELVAFAFLRVVEDFLTDNFVVTSVAESVESALEYASIQRSSEESFAGLEVFESFVLENSSAPLIQRLKRVVKDTQDLELSKARYELQSTLTKNGLGRINGLDTSEFDQLDDEVLAKVLTAASRAYKNSTLAGALYFVSRKGTDKAAFNAWYDQLLARRGWTRDGVEVAFKVARTTGSESSCERIRALSVDPASAFLAILEEAEAAGIDNEAGRLLGLYALDQETIRVGIADAIETRASRPLSDLVSSGSGLERASALLKACTSGVPTDDESVLAVYHALPKHLRIILVRQDAERQKYFSTVLCKSVGS